jgi:hypothetical protein
MWSGLALAPIALVVFLTSKGGTQEMYHGLTRWWAPVLLAWTSLLAVTSLGALWLRRFEVARLAGALPTSLGKRVKVIGLPKIRAVRQ